MIVVSDLEKMSVEEIENFARTLPSPTQEQKVIAFKEAKDMGVYSNGVLIGDLYSGDDDYE